jgi:hypothetical protein
VGGVCSIVGWIQYPTKTTIMDGLKAAEPGVAIAAKTLADLMVTHMERLDQPEAVASMVYSALARAAAEASGEKASKFDALVLAKVHGETICDLAVAMTVFIAREEEDQPVKGAELEVLVREAMGKMSTVAGP